jgi:hypothetical protein
MFGKVKKWLGIEGIKIELDLPEMAFEEVGAVSGQIRFYSKNPQVVAEIKVVMIERYTRGRGKEKLVDEYMMGKIEMKQRFEVPADDVLSVEFTLPFQREKSAIDEFEVKNFLSSGIAKMARMISNVHSEYRIEAEVKVEGTVLNPFDKKTIKLVAK